MKKQRKPMLTTILQTIGDNKRTEKLLSDADGRFYIQSSPLEPLRVTDAKGAATWFCARINDNDDLQWEGQIQVLVGALLTKEKERSERARN